MHNLEIKFNYLFNNVKKLHPLFYQNLKLKIVLVVWKVRDSLGKIIIINSKIIILLIIMESLKKFIIVNILLKFKKINNLVKVNMQPTMHKLSAQHQPIIILPLVIIIKAIT